MVESNSGRRPRNSTSRWLDLLRDEPTPRRLFNALCSSPADAAAAPLLAAFSRGEVVREIAGRAAGVGRVARTIPHEVGSDHFLDDTLCALYAMARVRDVLLLAHQPVPQPDGQVAKLDSALGREFPRLPPVPVDQMVDLFSLIGCKPLRGGEFDPIVHEIVVCEQAADPLSAIEVVEEFWPALLIGELVFCRAGVRVRAGAAHAVAGVADRSTLAWEYWRRHRLTSDGSFWWGTNSQWRTNFRRDYLTEVGRIYDFDEASTWSRRRRLSLLGRQVAQGPSPERISLIKNRCLLRPAAEDQNGWQPSFCIDERT